MEQTYVFSIFKEKTIDLKIGIPVGEVEKEKFQIRTLRFKDIPQISLARMEQEKENNLIISKRYKEQYELILEKLLHEKKIIGVGAFKEKQLVSLAFFNLLHFGNSKKIPYLCGVWTDPQHRQKGLAFQIHQRLIQELLPLQDEIQNQILLKLEGSKAAKELYKKEGYHPLKGEMTFLGDISVEPLKQCVIHENKENYCHKLIFQKNNQTQMQIDFSQEQFLAHPANIEGKTARITKINISEHCDRKEFQQYLSYLFEKNRFCKWNYLQLFQEGETSLKKLFFTEEKFKEELLKMKWEDKEGKLLP